MSGFLGLGPPAGFLRRFDTLSEAHPGETRWIANKGTDQSGHTNTENIDGTYQQQIYLYNNTAAVTVAGNWYRVVFDGDEETDPQIKAIGAGADAAYRLVVVAPKIYAAATWGWYSCAGICDAMVEGTTDVAKDDYLKFDVDTVSVTAPIKDGTDETDRSVAIATIAQAANSEVLVRVRLLGKRAVVST